MNFLLEFSKEQFTQKKLPFDEVLSSGGMVFLTGMLTVFAVLGILWLALLVFKFFFHDLSGGMKKTKKEKAVVAPADEVVESTDEKELIAVITAAIAMAESECGSNKNFRVVSFKRK